MGTAQAKVGELVDGKYELEMLLGQGGMGAVYRARHAVTGRRVAIKWLLEDDAERRRRFLREARAMGRLSHPNVVQVFDVSEHEGEIFLVMEYLSGKSLRDFVDEAPLSPKDAIARLMPALSGVAAAHQAGVLHRDLKPENLFVVTDQDGTPYDTKVLDFGLAKATEAEADSKLTQSGAIVGTPRYMSPEQLEEAEVDERADVYALGLILYEMLAGALPFRSRSLNALLLEILTADHPPPDQVRDAIPAELGAVVKRAIERDPADRIATVAELARAIEPFGETPYEPPRRSVTDSDPPPRLTPRVDDDAIRSSIRESRPDGERDSLDETRSETPTGKSHRRDAYAATETVSEADVSVARGAAGEPERATPARSRAWIPIALAVGLLVVGGGFYALAGQTADPPAPTTATGGDPPVEDPVEAVNDAVPAAVDARPDAPDEAPAVTADSETHDETGELAVEEDPSEAQLPPRDETGAETPAAHAARRPRPPRRRTTPRRSPPTTTTPTAAETTEDGPSLRVDSRAGVLRSDDF